MPSVGEDEFIEVTRDRKKRKALSSPTLPSQRKPGSSEPPLSPPVNPSSSVKNKIPVIVSGVDEKFKNWRQLLGELRQYHPSLRINHIKELPKERLFNNRRLCTRHDYTTKRIKNEGSIRPKS